MKADHRQQKTKIELQRILLADNSESLNACTFDEKIIPVLKNLKSGQVKTSTLMS